MTEELIKRLREDDTDPVMLKKAADAIEAQAAEIKRLREALSGMIDYSCFSERWQDDHPEYVAAARAALGETE
jgi:hypothetical protein